MHLLKSPHTSTTEPPIPVMRSALHPSGNEPNRICGNACLGIKLTSGKKVMQFSMRQLLCPLPSASLCSPSVAYIAICSMSYRIPSATERQVKILKVI